MGSGPAAETGKNREWLYREKRVKQEQREETKSKKRSESLKLVTDQTLFPASHFGKRVWRCLKKLKIELLGSCRSNCGFRL